jgi:hypothetical protein
MSLMPTPIDIARDEGRAEAFEVAEAALAKCAEMRAEIERLRVALEPFAKVSRDNPGWATGDPAYLDAEDGLTAGDFHRAAEALRAYEQHAKDESQR